MESEHGQSSPVEGTGPGVDVGRAPSLAAHPGVAATPGAAYEVGDLALDLGTVGPITRCHSGWPGRSGPLEEVFTAADADRASERDLVHARRKGHCVQWTLNEARPPLSRVGLMATCWPVGQVSVTPLTGPLRVEPGQRVRPSGFEPETCGIESVKLGVVYGDDDIGIDDVCVHLTRLTSKQVSPAAVF